MQEEIIFSLANAGLFLPYFLDARKKLVTLVYINHIKRIMKRFLLFIACIYCSIAYAKPVLYEFSLAEVVILKNGEHVVSNQPNQMSYADSIMTITWDISGAQLNFMLKNNTTSSFKLIWDDAVYIDPWDEISKVMHKGIKYTDREEHQQDSNIPAGGKLDDLAIPTDKIYWHDGYNGIGTGWKELPLLKINVKKKDFESLKQACMGKIIKIMLPVVIGLDKLEYTFSFIVKDVQLAD